MKTNFITNLPLEEISGGFSGMNHAAHGALEPLGEVRYVGPINPPVNRLAKIRSKAIRVVGGKGAFPFFSEARLDMIAAAVEGHSAAEADMDFFHGFTPWVKVRSSRPYIAWNDCSFIDYMSVFHDSSKFSRRDLERISRQEAEWLRGAEAVILSSEWATKRIIEDYNLDPAKVHSVGIFGALEPPATDAGPVGYDFLFVSTDYQKKNGEVCRQAMDLLWRSHPDALLRIVGAPPPASHLVPGKVIYEGFFKKSDPSDLEAFRSILASAFALIHPTDADTTAMILIEAAFFGCPAISVDDFAIPEVMCANPSTTLLERPVTPRALASAMAQLIEDKDRYFPLRALVRKQALSANLRADFSSRMQRLVLNALS